MNSINSTEDDLLTSAGLNSVSELCSQFRENLFHVKDDTSEVLPLTWQRSQYRAVINWLTKHNPSPSASNLEKVSGYLQACHHLFEVKNWEAAGKILSIRLNTPTHEQLHNQLNIWGYYREYRDLFTTLLGKLDSEWELTLLNGLGNLHNSLSDYQTAMDYQRQHLDVAKATGDRQSEGLALGNLGLNFYFLGDYHQSIQYSEQSLAIVREIGDRRAEGAALGNLGLAYDAVGDFKKAIDYHWQYLAIARDINKGVVRCRGSELVPQEEPGERGHQSADSPKRA